MADAKSETSEETAISEDTDFKNTDTLEVSGTDVSSDNAVIDEPVADDIVEADHQSDAYEPHIDEPIEPAGHEPVVDYDEHDDRHPSLSSRVLTWLAVLVAGAGIALWGGPKLAPQLPEWAAPASKFLTPGGDAALRDVTALRTEVTERLEAVPEVLSKEDLTALIQAELATAQAAIQAETDGKLAEIEAQIASADTSNMDARISTLESQIEGLSAELGALTTSVQTALSEGGTISDETLAEITSKSAEVEGVKAQLGEITGQVSTLTQRIENAEVAAQEQLEAAKAEAALAQERASQMAANTAYLAAFEALSEKAVTGNPYATELNALVSLTDADIPEVLSANATSGVAAVSTLSSQLAELSHASIRASIKDEVADDSGTVSRFGAFLKSQMATRSLEPTDGDSADAVLSRISAALGDGNLDGVLSEASSLSDSARAPLADWLSSVETRKSVLDTLAGLSAQAT